MNKHSGINHILKQIKNLKTLLVVVFLLFFVVGVFYIYSTWQVYSYYTQKNALALAESAEAFLSVDLLRKLEASPNDLGKPEYEQIKENLIQFKNRNQNVYFAYLYTLADEKIFFIADSEEPESEEYSPPGQEYTEASQSTKKPFADGKSILTQPETDRWGTFVSALVPVKDEKTGEVMAVFGIDFSAKQWKGDVVRHVQHAAILVACILMLLMAYYSMLTKNRALQTLGAKLKTSELLFRTVFEQAPNGIAIGRNHRLISNINAMFEKIVGRSKEELTSLSWTKFTHPDDLEEDLNQFSKLKSGEIDRYSMVKRFIKPDGSHVWVNMTVAPLRLQEETEQDQKHLCLIEDISERVQAEKALRESERSKGVLLSHLPGMAYRCTHDRAWTMQFVSDGCFALTGYQPESLLYNKDLSYNQLISPQYREILWREWERILALKLPFKYEYEINTGTGETKWVLELGQGVYDEKGNVEALEGIVIDISPQKKREAQIQYMNDYDFMTGVYNRNYFEQMKKQLDDDKKCQPLSIIIADINGVRLINDAFGYAEGDRIITEAAKIIQSCCREGDIMGRTGGDEFRILLPNTNNDEAYIVLRSIMSTYEAYSKNSKDRAYDISLSVGYGTKDATVDSIDRATKQAEDYMLKGKLLDRKSSHSAIVSSVMATMYAKSHETEEHAQRIALLSKMIGEKLNLPQKSLDELELLAMLHDIGKVGIDDYILNKPGKLSDEEWIVMKKHPEIGHRIAQASPELESIAEYILSHHERWDGKGYPRGLQGEEIPLLSRILAVADAYDAMTEDRVYRKALTKEEAVAEIKNNMGSQLDPNITKIFLESIVS